jgi:hypothetical protein
VNYFNINTVKNKLIMTYNLYLDDFRNPIDSAYYRGEAIYAHEEWVIVRNYDEFVKCIQENGLPEIISFDHDLADTHYDNQDHVDGDYYDIVTEKTGYHCAKWLIDYCIDNNKKLPARILIHSMNPAGSQNIKSLFESYLKSLKL